MAAPGFSNGPFTLPLLLQSPDGSPLLSVGNPMIPLLLRSAPPVQTAELLAGSEAPAGANGAQKGTHSLCREYLIQRWIEGARRRIGGGRTIPHIFWLFNCASDTRAPCSRRVLRGFHGSSAMTSVSTRHVVTLFPPQPRLLPGFLLPALFGVPALQRSLGRPCFSDFHTRLRDQRGGRAT